MQDCPEEPTHGYDGEPATFCQAHMAVGMKVSERGIMFMLRCRISCTRSCICIHRIRINVTHVEVRM